MNFNNTRYFTQIYTKYYHFQYNQYKQNHYTSAWIKHNIKIINEVFYIPLLFQVFDIQCIFYTYSASQYFHVASGILYKASLESFLLPSQPVYLPVSHCNLIVRF